MGADFTLWRSFLRTKYALPPKQTLPGAGGSDVSAIFFPASLM